MQFPTINRWSVIPGLLMTLIWLHSAWAKVTSCQPGQWSLTFDDGPHPSITPVILDSLKKANVTATFFVLGEKVEKYPDMLKKVHAAGHEIAVHTWSHPHLTSISAEEIREEIRSTLDVVYETIGVKPTLIRPPYGETNEMVESIMAEFGLEAITWNVDSNDWRYAETYNDSPVAGEATKQGMLKSLAGINPTTNGVISLHHDIHQASAYVLGDIIPAIQAKGFKLSTVQECIKGSTAPWPSANPISSTNGSTSTSVETATVPTLPSQSTPNSSTAELDIEYFKVVLNHMLRQILCDFDLYHCFN
ncbi:chitin deacetylase [Dispira parvispora]|uniref:Chitin deacetylase n=1 Tax=Dispira parvispora TaxID=1520584 RepID=A0A9W8AQD8_9FUNG|nr:chitin deacetylase [Dispira parvispora]